MKLTKYLLIACSALVLASCGNDDDWNTANDVTVQMADATISTRENKKTFNVPLEVIGKANGPIRVTVDVTEVSQNAAVENVNYIITSNSVVIPDNDAKVSIEICPINDKEINEDRIFIISIVNVEGAKIGEQSSTEVVIRDDDSIPYEAIQGDWTFFYTDLFDGSDGEFTITIEGLDDEDPQYGHLLYISGWGGEKSLTAEVGFKYDAVSDVAEIKFPYGQILGQLPFSVGDCDIMLTGCDGNSFYTSGSCTAYSEDRNSIVFDPYDGFYLLVLNNGQQLGGWAGFLNISLKR